MSDGAVGRGEEGVLELELEAVVGPAPPLLPLPDALPVAEPEPLADWDAPAEAEAGVGVMVTTMLDTMVVGSRPGPQVVMEVRTVES